MQFSWIVAASLYPEREREGGGGASKVGREVYNILEAKMKHEETDTQKQRMKLSVSWKCGCKKVRKQATEARYNNACGK